MDQHFYASRIGRGAVTAPKLGTKRKEKLTNPKKLCNVFIDVGCGNVVIELIFSRSIGIPATEITYPRNLSFVQPQRHLRNWSCRLYYCIKCRTRRKTCTCRAQDVVWIRMSSRYTSTTFSFIRSLKIEFAIR